MIVSFEFITEEKQSQESKEVARARTLLAQFQFEFKYSAK